MPRKKNLFFTTPAFVAGILLLNLRPMIDKLFATHHFSSAEIVLMGTVNLITFIPECMVLSTSYAIQSLSSQTEEHRKTFHYLAAGLGITLCILLPVLCSMSLFPTFFLKLVSSSSPSDSASISFFRFRLLGCFFQCLIFCLRGFYAAHRNNRIFFSVIAISLIIHTLLNLVLFSGHGWLPQIGIQGMGLSYGIAMLFGLSIYTEQLLRDMATISFTLPTRTAYYKLLRLSIPLTLHGIIDHIGTTLIFFCTGRFYGLLPLASLHLVSSIQGISPGAGFGLTALTEVTKANTKTAFHAKKIGWTILLAGAAILGSVGIFASLFSSQILELAAPGKLALQQSTRLPLQIMLTSLGLHVGCQVVLKILQAIDQTVASVSINLAFIYGFRIPLLFSLGYMTGGSVVTVSLILVVEKILKLSAMIIYWHRKSSPSTQLQPTLQKQIL